MATIEENLTREFADALRAARPEAKIDDLGYAGFADSLVEGIDADRVRRVFGTADSRGPGSRQPRLYAAHSGTMLLVNVFAPWLDDLASLELLGLRGFGDLRFEVRLPSVAGEPAGWLPALLIAPDGVVGIESDCAGFLSGHPAKFAAALDRFWDDREENGWRREMRALQEGRHGYARLDAARLIKQYMGLRLLLEAAAGSEARIAPATLLYLYWEPLNAARFDECDEHHAEIAQFHDSVSDSDIDFAAMSYFDLWAEWARGDAPSWLPLHLTRLHQRYSFRI
ncbi:MAG: hypothetical protein JSU82_02180 [Rhodospirillales bacterium]|nr:MAG: hypothetical protein JSU82_02180 [Rhodospirillales bacterium]